MGCAASRAACEGEEIPVKVRPVLHRRFTEHRQKKKSVKNDFIDEKKLLRGDQECTEVEHSSRSSSSHDDSLQKLRQPLLKTEKTTEPPVLVAMLPIAKENNAALEGEEKHENEHGVKEEKSIMKRESNVEKSFGEKAKVAVAESKEEEEEEEEEGEDERRMLCKNNDEQDYDCPGSPSFRVYCVECVETTDDEGHSDEEIDLPHDNEVHENWGQDHNSSHNQDISHEATPIISVKDPETDNNVVRKKGKKGRRFGRVMPKAGRAAVKNLWHGKLCYDSSLSCSSHHHHHDKTRLLPKPAA